MIWKTYMLYYVGACKYRLWSQIKVVCRSGLIMLVKFAVLNPSLLYPFFNIRFDKVFLLLLLSHTACARDPNKLNYRGNSNAFQVIILAEASNESIKLDSWTSLVGPSCHYPWKSSMENKVNVHLYCHAFHAWPQVGSSNSNSNSKPCRL